MGIVSKLLIPVLSQFSVKINLGSKNKPTQNPYPTPAQNPNFSQVPALGAALLKQKVPLNTLMEFMEFSFPPKSSLA